MNVEKSVGDGQMLTNQLGPRVIVVFTLDPLISIQKSRISIRVFSKLGNHYNDYCGVFDFQDRFCTEATLVSIKEHTKSLFVVSLNLVAFKDQLH
jgi:hypothetical protein